MIWIAVYSVVTVLLGGFFVFSVFVVEMVTTLNVLSAALAGAVLAVPITTFIVKCVNGSNGI